MNEITYIFGAGASCQSMPLVSNFSIRFQIFEEYIEQSQPSSILLSHITQFKKEVEGHFSFDTFFKKLFHQNNNDAIIERYKGILLIFFLFEHVIPPERLKSYSLFRKQMIDKTEKRQNIDPRYEALIAGLLKPLKGKIDFYANINFFTWNYDVNLLYALKNFIAPGEKFIDFIGKGREDNYFKINEQVKVFHLNGVIYHPLLNHFNNDNSVEGFQNVVRRYEDDPEFKKYLHNIKFAWEQENLMNDTVIGNCILNSKNIILIGYSLPLYNRKVDSFILDSSKLRGKKLIIQNLNSQGILEILESDFNIASNPKNISKENPTISGSDNCNSFIVPNSIFS